MVHKRHIFVLFFCLAPHGFVQQFLAASSSAEQVLVVKDLYYKEEKLELELEHFLADLLLASP